MQFWVRIEMHCTQIVWELYKMWMSMFTQFRYVLEYTVTRFYQKYTCSEWVWLYASGYPLKCIAPLFPIGTRNLHSSQFPFKTSQWTTGNNFLVQDIPLIHHPVTEREFSYIYVDRVIFYQGNRPLLTLLLTLCGLASRDFTRRPRAKRSSPWKSPS